MTRLRSKAMTSPIEMTNKYPYAIKQTLYNSIGYNKKTSCYEMKTNINKKVRASKKICYIGEISRLQICM